MATFSWRDPPRCPSGTSSASSSLFPIWLVLRNLSMRRNTGLVHNEPWLLMGKTSMLYQCILRTLAPQMRATNSSIGKTGSWCEMQKPWPHGHPLSQNLHRNTMHLSRWLSLHPAGERERVERRFQSHFLSAWEQTGSSSLYTLGPLLLVRFRLCIAWPAMLSSSAWPRAQLPLQHSLLPSA